jgi:hypothetical protein
MDLFNMGLQTTHVVIQGPDGRYYAVPGTNAR